MANLLPMNETETNLSVLACRSIYDRVIAESYYIIGIFRIEFNSIIYICFEKIVYDVR